VGGEGGNGGGALRIFAATIYNDGEILCNGDPGKNGIGGNASGGGGGSGGAIHLHATRVIAGKTFTQSN